MCLLFNPLRTYILAESGSIVTTTRYIEELEQGISQLSQFPYLGSVTTDPILSLKKYRLLMSNRYVVVYRVIEDLSQVYIIRVLHQTSVQLLHH